MHEQRTQKWEKDVTTWVHLLVWQTKPRDSHVTLVSCLWIRSLPVSVVRIDLFTDTAAILKLLDLKSIMG